MEHYIGSFLCPSGHGALHRKFPMSDMEHYIGNFLCPSGHAWLDSAMLPGCSKLREVPVNVQGDLVGLCHACWLLKAKRGTC